MNDNEIDMMKVGNKIFKYFTLGLIIAISASYVSSQKIEQDNIFMIAAISSLAYAILDTPIFS